jgi:error-prone DNA polymerase
MNGSAELHCHSCFSFLDGASHPEELVARALELGYTALALTDHNGLYGSMEFAQAAQQQGLQAITGAEVTLEDEAHLTLLAETPEGYANLCRLLSLAHRENERLSPQLPYSALAAHSRGLIALSGCRLGEVPRLLDANRPAAAERAVHRYREWFGSEGFFLELQQNLAPGDTRRVRALAELGRRLGIPLVATNNTHYHVRERHRLQDTLVAIRHGVSLPEARCYRRPNSEYALKRPATLRARFAAYPEALPHALEIAERCQSFDLTRDLGYRFPDFQDESDLGSTADADAALAVLCRGALKVRYAAQGRERLAEADRWLEEELRLVKLHGLAGFFLVYRDLLQLSKQVAAEIRCPNGTPTARGRFELPPGRGRGSAVSSIICYLIGLSPVDPVQARLFPGRFLNESLQTVPDIDLDFPRDIREELIRRVHRHYGEDHVAMVCIFPTYRFRGAVREVGKALALPPAELDRLAKLGDGRTRVEAEMAQLPEFAPYRDNHLWRHLMELSEQLWGMPRHLSQHVGGIIISSRPLVEIVPIEHSAMDGRQLCQWDKDSCDAARMIKIDFLALGMLSAVEECLELIAANGKPEVDLSRINFQDPVVYNRICRGETIGAFQIESRAQVGMLVRTRPRTMEDLAIQIAIVRPGPVVANSVNPYVREREKLRTRRNYRPRFDHPLLSTVLADTLGVIIYQDQVMEVCKALAGFTDGEADQLRRAMSRKRSRENMERFRELFMEGAAARGVSEETALLVFEKVVSFSAFGFPKSHSAAFAVLAFQSVWLLHYHPAEFVASLLNNQPMGFYGPDTLIKDAQRQGVRFLSPDCNRSELRATVQGRTVRLGLSSIRHVGKSTAEAILAERAERGPFRSLTDFVRRTRCSDRVVESLILVGAADGFGLNRRELLWQLGLLYGQRGNEFRERAANGWKVVGHQGVLGLPVEQDQVSLAPAGRWEQMAHDYRLMSLSLEEHPIGMLRPALPREVVTIRGLRRCADQSTVVVAGMVTTRQRPETAKGILFLLMEDETGMLNVVVRPECYAEQRQLYRSEPLLMVRGVLEQKARRLNLVAEEAWPLTEALPDPVKSAAARRVYQAIREFEAPEAHQFR